MPAEVAEAAGTPEEAVEQIRMTPANPSLIRPAAMKMADVLQVAPSNPTFDLASWQRQWSEVGKELKSMTQANDVAEGRSR